jgi:urocanate hydratase
MSASLGDELPPTQLNSPASSIPEVPDVYAYFSALVALAKDHFNGELGGKLLLYGQLDARGAATTLAANIAGAATLGIDANSERLRQGIRHGFCDFVVNNLDEALRILKNEVRKKRPVSVCLEGDLAATLREAVERGLQPDLLALPAMTNHAEILIERGAIVVDDGVSNASLIDINWTAESASPVWLPKVDALAVRVLPNGDERSRWLKFAPRYLGRTMAAQHYLQMTVEEAEQFESLVVNEMASGAIGTKITIQRQERRLPGPPR